MTIKEAAETAIAVQDAVNLSGVVTALHTVMPVIWAEAHDAGKGTEYVNRHPVVTLFIDKMADLNGCQTSFDAYDHAYNECKRIAGVA